MSKLEEARNARDIALMHYNELRANGVSFRRLAAAEKELTRLGDEVRRLEREAGK